MAPTEGKDIVRAWYYDGKFKSTGDLQIEISRLSNKGELEWQCKFPQSTQ
ncbi:hypothetical protein MASR1M65_29830 [Saprospiraceae bacterium]